MKKLKEVLEASDRLHMISDVKVITDNADNNDKLKFIVQPKSSNGTSRLKDVIDFLDEKYKNDYKLLDKGDDKSPLQIETDKYVIKALLSTSLLNDLTFSALVIK